MDEPDPGLSGGSLKAAAGSGAPASCGSTKLPEPHWHRPLSDPALAAASLRPANYARNGKLIAIAGGPGAINGRVDIISPGRPFDSSRLASPSDLLALQLKASVFIEFPVQPGHMFSMVPCYKAAHLVVGLEHNVPVQPGAATLNGAGVKGV